MKNFIPKSKFDFEAIENLKKLDFVTIRPYAPQLLEWLQDMNWPVACEVADYLAPYFKDLTKEIFEILTSDDVMWKYWIINEMRHRSIKPDPDLLPILNRIVNNPDKEEKENELDLLVKELFENINDQATTGQSFQL